MFDWIRKISCCLSKTDVSEVDFYSRKVVKIGIWNVQAYRNSNAAPGCGVCSLLGCCALGTPTVDGTSEEVDTTIGYEGRAKVEARLRQLEGGSIGATNGDLKAAKTAKYDAVAAKTAAAAPAYNDKSDIVMDDAEPETPKEKKKKKKEKRKSKGADDEDGAKSPKSDKKKKKKRKAEEDDDSDEAKKSAKKAKKKRKST